MKTLLSLLLPLCCAALCQAAPPRPHVILILADEVGARDLTCYAPRQNGPLTPALDGLAANGARFRTCWATPLCSPSRVELLTGLYATRTGAWHNSYQPSLAELLRHRLLPQRLRAAGYETVLAGNPMLLDLNDLRDYRRFGFERAHAQLRQLTAEDKGDYLRLSGGPVWSRRDFHQPSGYWHPAIKRDGEMQATTAADYAPAQQLRFIEDFLAQPHERPFFIYWPTWLIHHDYDATGGAGGYVPVPGRDGTPPAGARPAQGALREANLAMLDRLVGSLVIALERHGLRRDTLLIFTGDNGGVEYGKYLTVDERGVHVPLIMNWPGRIAPRVCDELTDFTDLTPTLCELAGAALPEGEPHDGRSLAPLLLGRPFTPREWIFSYCGQSRMVRTPRWLLDGHGTLYDCGSSRTEWSPPHPLARAGAEAARREMETVLARLPAPQIPPRQLADIEANDRTKRAWKNWETEKAANEPKTP